MKRELGNTGISNITELENHNNSLAIIKNLRTDMEENKAMTESYEAAKQRALESLKDYIDDICRQVVRNNHEIGDSYDEQDEDGWGHTNEAAANNYYYQEDDWCIEIEYDCYGEWGKENGDYWHPSSCELKDAWGEVTAISAYYYDDELGEQIFITEDELGELIEALNKELEHIY